MGSLPDSDAQVLPTVPLPNLGDFQSNKNFLTLNHRYNDDKRFLGYCRLPWVRKKLIRDTRRERELILTLLASQDDPNNDYVDKLIEEKISFRDLASLNNEDLEIFGFNSQKRRKELLELFAELPNQDPSYEDICRIREAEKYNNQILDCATEHLAVMRSALAAANYKMYVLPPENVPIGDKFYASSFSLDALDSLKNVVDDIRNDLMKLEKINKQKINGSKEIKKKKIYQQLGLICLGGITFGIVFSIWLWKFKKIA